MARNLLAIRPMMTTTRFVVLAGLAITPLAAPPPTAAQTVTISDADAASDPVAVTDVRRRGDAVVGNLVNRGPDEVRDIRLLIDIPFLWKNELEPGDETPARATVMTGPGPLPPGGRAAFEFTPNPPLPERTDGRFADPNVRIMGYTHVATR